MRRFLPLFLLCALCGAPRAWGSAFAINELGVRAQGMAGAFASIADDGSAIFFNPAGMAFLCAAAMLFQTTKIVTELPDAGTM